MLEIEKLEKEWRRYKLKRLKPLFLVFAGIIFALGAYIVLPSFESGQFLHLFKQKDSQIANTKESLAGSTISEPKISAAEAKSNTKKTATSSIASSPRPKSSTMTLMPETNFLNSFKKVDQHRHSPDSPEATHIPSSHKKTTTAKKPQPKKKKIDETATNDKNGYKRDSTRTSLIVRMKTSNNTLEYLIERFNERRDPKLAAYIAQSYYKKKEFEEAIKWSIMANSLDPSDEGSWLLYAKAKVRIGKKKDAIRALRAYLNQYSSQKVKAYLHNLEHSL